MSKDNVSGTIKILSRERTLWYNPSSMKKVIVSLRLAGINARQELTGIFRYLGKSQEWDIRVLSDVAELKRELASRSRSAQPDGIIIDATCPDDAVALLATSRVPLVAMDLMPVRFGRRTRALKCIRCDDGAIGIVAARHFLSCGNFLSFAFIPPIGRPRSWAQRREEAFRVELSRHGRMATSYEARESDAPADDHVRLAAWLKSIPKPAAVFASWDGRARQVLEACREIGASVPSQIAVLGVDNDELLCESSVPPLSSVIPDPETEGFMAAKALDELMKDPARGTERVKICRIKGIAQRESTSSIAPAAALVRKALVFIKGNFRHPIGVPDVVAHLRVSRRLADRRFREIQGETILATITRLRLEHLASRLAQSKRAIKTLIPAAGFGSLNQAKVLFRRAYGMSMREWRTKKAEQGFRQT